MSLTGMTALHDRDWEESTLLAVTTLELRWRGERYELVSGDIITGRPAFLREASKIGEWIGFQCPERFVYLFMPCGWDLPPAPLQLCGSWVRVCSDPPYPNLFLVTCS